jgi:hypothetical protein
MKPKEKSEGPATVEVSGAPPEPDAPPKPKVEKGPPIRFRRRLRGPSTKRRR